MLVLLPLEAAEHAHAAFAQLLAHETFAVYCLPVQEVYGQDFVALDVLEGEDYQCAFYVDVGAVRQALVLEGVELLPDAQDLGLGGSHIFDGLFEFEAAEADGVDFVDLHGLVGEAALEGEGLAVQQVLVGQVLELLVEELLVLGVGFNLPGEGSVLLSKLLLLGLLVNERLVDDDELVLADLPASLEVRFLAEPLHL